MSPDTLSLVIFAVLGAVIGSFLNVCITRWPEGLSILRPPSRCPHCERPIKWHENIPMVGWLRLRGKCAGCKASISPLYPLVELVNTAIWLAVAWQFGVGFLALRVAIFCTLMLGIALTDLRAYTIPDGFTVFGFFWLIGTSVIATVMGDARIFASGFSTLLGACAAAGAIAILGWLGEVFLKKEAMGFGDVTLLAVIGAAVGPILGLLSIFIGAALAAVGFGVVVAPIAAVRAHNRKVPFEMPLVPFGVFLAPAAVVVLLWGNAMLQWYVRWVVNAAS